MTSSVEAPSIDAPRSESADHDQIPRVLIGLAAAGIALVVLAEPITSLLVEILPGRTRLRSLGTNFEAFDEVGPALVGRNGWVLVLSCVVAAVTHRFSERHRAPGNGERTAHALITTTLVAVTAAWYGWLSTPHNAFPSNARFHWVDYITWDTDDYFYALGRIPHRIFYDAPWMWQSINAALAVVLCYLIARRLGIGRGLSTALASVIAVSGNLLLFANTAEDVLLNVTLLLLLLYASLRRIGWFVGLALLLLILGRPSFAIVALALPAAELVLSLRHRQRPSRQQVAYVATAAVVCGAGVLATQIYFTIAGRRYFLTEGRLVYVPELDGATAREVDGFTLSAWSGAFSTHVFWVIPIFILVGAVAATVVANRQKPNVESTVYLAVSAAGLLVMVLEANPLLYYNVRYLTYILPLLLVAAWTLLGPGILDRERGRGSRWSFGMAPSVFRPLVASLLVLSPLVFPSDPVGTKRRVEARAELELLDVRSELRALAKGRDVYLTFGSSGSRNYLSYVLRDDPHKIQLPSEEGPGTGLVIARRGEAPSDVEALIETETFVVFLNRS